MSQKATDASVLILSAGAASVPIGGMTALIVYALGNANPVSLAIGAGAPAALAIPILALAALVKRAKQTVPDVHHHHYNGTVVQDQRQLNTSTRGIWASTRNQLPK
jgi:cytochrome c biogenesis protein CcdA